MLLPSDAEDDDLETPEWPPAKRLSLVPSDAEDDDPVPLEWPPLKRHKAAQARDAERLKAGGKICTKSKCNHLVAFDDPHKTCEMCRARGQRRIESGAHAAFLRDWKETPEGQAYAQRDRETQKANGNKAASARRQVENGNKAKSDKRRVENGNKAKSDKRRIESGALAAAQRAYRQTPEGQASVQRDRKNQKANGNKAASDRRQVENGNKAKSDKKYKTSDKGKETNKRYWSSLKARLACSLRKILAGTHDHTDPSTFASYGIHFTEAGLQAHFSSLFDVWMSWDNHGPHVIGAPYKTRWNIGHRIAKSLYDHNDPDEVRRCWSFDNLFPQDAKENLDEGKRYLPSREVLLSLRHIWPKKWNGQLPSDLTSPLAPDDEDEDEDEEPEPPRSSSSMEDSSDDDMSELDSDPSAGSD